MIKFRAVIFDLDGTLLDTLADLGNSANRVLQSRGYPFHPLDAYKYFVGDGARTLITRVLPETGRSLDTIEECLQLFLADYKSNWAVDTKPYPGIIEMLSGFEKSGLSLSVLSNKPDAVAKLSVKKFFPRHKFNHVIGQSDFLPKKPDPSGALKIAELESITPHSFLYLGDTSIDMKTAIGAGMYPVGACWGFRTEQELLESGAKALVREPRELLDIIASPG